ncbi:hypothetical protein GYMLUDRAFT_254693 [Collybiopsis luxurians FD-317 M1]|nr:hypothetical protein GYMLUDRAFT_254693 [Collybiopsis luxurians FD-317 M1]
MSSDVRSTLGAALAGCLAAVALSAVLGFQTFLYFHIFPSDGLRYKLLVGWIWATDTLHTILICTSVWHYLILNFSNPSIVDKIFSTIPITIVMTAIITLSVNSFYGWRIYKMSKRNWWLTGPIAFLSVARVGLAFATASEMIIMKTFPAFAARFRILFTSGLFVSAVTDIIVSAARYHYLRTLKEGYSQTQEVVDAVVVFTINDGVLTCAVVIASIACWLGMPHNFVYLGIYFTISKFYSNSVLATLNLRNWYRHRYAWPRPLGLSMIRTTAGHEVGAHSNGRSDSIIPISNGSTNIKHAPSEIDGERMEVYVDRRVEYDVSCFIGDNLDEPEAHLNKSTETPTTT